jgi:nicotinate dehydrogenase subunit B
MMANRRQFLKTSGALVVCFALPGCERESTTVAAPAAPGTDGHAALGNRLRIDSAGAVRLNLGKVELGQGIGTALAQIAAEELGIDISRITVAGVDTDHSPDESYTFSSISIQQSGPPVRRAAASGRQFLLQRAAQALDASPADLNVVDGEILASGAPTGLDYWQLLAGERYEVESLDDAPLLPVSNYRIIGKPVQRLDIPAKVFGQASFLQDLRLPGMVHARVIRPPAERAQLKEFKSAPAADLPGVLKLVRDGNFVAVIAERESQAQTAAEVLRKSLSWSLAGDLPGSEGIYQWLKSAPARTELVARRQSDWVADSETRTIRATYQRPFQAHASISPSAALALFQDEKLTIWSHAQGMYPLRTAIAHVLGLRPEQVRCIHQPAAGCFGHNGADDAACDAAALALEFPGRPIRLQWGRADEFSWEPYGSAMHIETRAELDQEGRVRSWDFDLWSCPHTSRPRSTSSAGHLIYAQHRAAPLDIPPASSIPQPHGGADRNAIPLYAFESMQVNKHLVTEVPVRVSALRGLGAYANIFAIESFMDELALASGQDPLAFRLRHLQDPRAIALLEKLSAVSNWPARPAPGHGEGWGLGFARFKNLSSYVGIVFQLRVDPERAAITLQRATAVCDAGLVINPDGVRAQIEGGIVQSASWTLKEQLRFTESRIQSRDWASYPILRFDEVPDIQVFLMPHDSNPALGVGEAAQGPTAAAIANAVFHASGRRVRKLPLTPEHFFDSVA